MFLQRTFAAFKSLCFRRPPDHDQNAEARVILQRVRELMEITPAPLASCGADSRVTLEAVPAVSVPDPYGETAYAEDAR